MSTCNSFPLGPNYIVDIGFQQSKAVAAGVASPAHCAARGQAPSYKARR